MNGTPNRGHGRLAAVLGVAAWILAGTPGWAQTKPSARATHDATRESSSQTLTGESEAEGSLETRKNEARRLWQEAVELARQGDAEGALAGFRKSQALYPHEETLRNMALLEVDLEGLEADGASHLAQYLATKGDIEEADRKTLEGILAETEKKVGRLEVDVVPANANLELDGKRVDPPLTGRVLYVIPGQHHVTAWLPDSEPEQKDIVVARGQAQVWSIDLAASNESTPGATRPPENTSPVRDEPLATPAEGQWPNAKLWAVAGGGAFSAIALGVGIYGHVALSSARDDVKHARASVDETFGDDSACFSSNHAQSTVCQRLADADGDQERAGDVATAGWIAAGTFAAATAAAWLLWPNERTPGARNSAGGTTVMGPWAPGGGAGWVVTGRF